jgi:uncharacterized protein (TIGR01777 family)
VIVVVSGASGMIGQALVQSLSTRGHRVRRLVRPGSMRGADDIAWDPEHGELDPAALSDAAAVVNLAGANIAQRWTSSAKQAIVQSRVRGTSTIAVALARTTPRPPVLVSASAIGYYGAHPSGVVDESSPAGDDFLAHTCVKWERATEAAIDAGIRVVTPRLGVVLEPDGGVLGRLLPPFRLGVGGKLGGGAQWMSWVAIEDVVRAIEFAIATPALSGPVNVVAPTPVTNAEFTTTLARVLHRPALFPVPALALELGFGEMARVTVLASQRVSSRRLDETGFQFAQPELERALRTMLHAA